MAHREIKALGLNEANTINHMLIQDIYNKFTTGRINFPECQREPDAWSTEKKRKLIDSILRGYQLPMFYFKPYDENGQDKFWVYDGQQRIGTIVSFIKNEFSLKSTKNFKLESIRFSDTKIQKFDTDDPVFYRSLVDAAVEKILKTHIHYYSLPPLPDEFLDETFTRLQEGQSLSGVERRRAHSTQSVVIRIKEIAFAIEEHRTNRKCFEFLNGRSISYALAEQALKIIQAIREREEEDDFGGITTTELKELYGKTITNADVTKTQKIIRKMASIFNSTDLLEKGDSKFISNKFIPFFLTINKLEESTAREKELGIRKLLLKFLHELDKITQARKDNERDSLTGFDNRAVKYYEASQEKGTDQHGNLKIRYENLHNYILTSLE